MSLNSCVLINIQHGIHVKYLIVGKIQVAVTKLTIQRL